MTCLPRHAACSSKTGLCLLLLHAVLLNLILSFVPSDVGAQTRGISMQAASLAGLSKDEGTYRALLIGNDAYPADQGPWKPLKTAVAGAKALKHVLFNQYGFTDVKLIENASRREILLALQALSRRVMPGDSVLMYYAGHGYLNMDTRRGYWVPVDARDTDHTTFLRNSTIRDELGIIASRAKHTLLISDSCFSGTLLRGGSRGISAQMGTEAYYRKVANKKSIQVLTAGGVEYVDDDYQTSGHSPFTYFLLNELKNNDRLLLTAGELSTNVEKAVANNVDQVPESGVVQGAGDELGEFIFINIDLAVPGVPKEKVKVQVNVVDADSATSRKEGGDLSLDFGIELLAGGWSGKNKASDTDYDGGGGQIGLNLALNKGRFYTAIGLRGGSYTFKDDAPQQVSATQATSQEDVQIAHSELDLAVGYYFWRHLALFLDLQNTNRKWNNNDYEMRYTGLGGGLLANWPISSRWDLVGKLSVLTQTTVRGDDDDIGDVSGGGLEIGTAYRPHPRHRLGIGLRLESRSYDFDAGGKQDDRMVGLFLNYAYRFGF